MIELLPDGGTVRRMGKRCARVVQALMVATLAGLTSASSPAFYGHDRIRDSDQYIARTTLEKMIEQKLTRDEIIQRLGAPDGTNAIANTIGYERCVSSTGISLFGPATVKECQRTIIWFDEGGRAKE
jgi:hypothetical protein